MKKPYLPPASYQLWSLFKSQEGKQQWFCDMKRGFQKVRQNEPEVKALLNQDNKYQKIGIIAQRGVYEFHQCTEILQENDGLEQLVKILELDKELEEVQERVFSILKKYQQTPILLGKQIIQLSKGDEKNFSPITIQQGNSHFNLYAPTDCIFKHPDGTIHILDFKTGKSDFDRRQAYVYLLAASYLYPQQPSVASFYNLETGISSELITATPERLMFVQIELGDWVKQIEIEKIRYRQKPSDFAEIFPANPGQACSYCTFNRICEFSMCEV